MMHRAARPSEQCVCRGFEKPGDRDVSLFSYLAISKQACCGGDVRPSQLSDLFYGQRVSGE